MEEERSFHGQNDLYSRQNIMKKYFIPKFTDVTLLLNSHMPIIIDGDSLMITALTQENYQLKLGGQNLHLIYYCERLLDIIKERGGNYVIMFFEIWNVVWNKNYFIKTCRAIIYNHFKFNTNIKVYTSNTFYSEEFLSTIKALKPRCVLLNVAMYIDLDILNGFFETHLRHITINIKQAIDIFIGQVSAFCNNDLPCVDMNEITVHASVIHSFIIDSSRQYVLITQVYKKIIQEKYKCFPIENENLLISNLSNMTDVRRAVVIFASIRYMQQKKDVIKLKLFLLYYSAVETLLLGNRSCPQQNLKEINQKLLLDVLNWHEDLYFALMHITQCNIKVNWCNIADLWQGTLFSYICHLLESDILNGEMLGIFKEPYENLIYLLNDQLENPIYPYPINQIITNTRVQRNPPVELAEQVKMIPIDNPLIRSFCGDTSEVTWANPKIYLKHQEFDELRHWHSGKPLTDESDHIYDTIGKKQENEKDKRFYMKNISKQARYMNLYGRSLEGNRQSEIIICQDEGSKKKGNSKVKKPTKNAQKIIEQNKQQKNKEKYDKEIHLLTKFKSNLDKNLPLNKLQAFLEELNISLNKLTLEESKLKGNLLKLKLLSYITKTEFMISSNVNLNYVKELFIIIRNITSMQTKLDDKDNILISTLLHQFGFGELAQLNNYPLDMNYKKMLELNWIRYQLEYLGPELERKIDSEYDDDVGYAPDPWQREFIKVIRHNDSALVVAPTSSGKTFASYYCMKRILQKSSDGIIVYVSPTKALVNQVAATIYHRFSSTKLPDGISVVGVFTRDFKTNATNCRILVTVPQCLDILLLSPRRYTWFNKVKYVIFDEVHRLSGHEEGLVWERCLLLIRCPFLALSATIEEPTRFHHWLQQIEKFKQEQDYINNSVRPSGSYKVELVIHSERHSDLIKYTYGEKGLQHYHPYCALTKTVLEMHAGVPSTVTLSPRETLQLFDAIYANEESRQILSVELHLENFFRNNCSKGFINRNIVREYEKLLSEAFYKIYLDCEESYENILSKLESDNNNMMNLNVISLLDEMHERNMLPTIIFSYNRALIEDIHEEIIESCEESNVPIDHHKEKKNSKMEKIVKKQREKEEAKHNIEKDAIIESPLNILRDTGSKFKGVGLMDVADIQFIETNRLRGFKNENIFIKGLQHGVAYHHAGLNNKVRSSVEMLFRVGLVKVVLATGTLALGIHMPCKSVVIYGDSLFLNSLEFHQMSGRAGRRGFDTEGNVIFMGLSKKRHDILMTDKLPKLLGNFPINVTLILQLLLLISKVTDKNCVSERAVKLTTSRALTLLENSLIFQTNPLLKEQIKYFLGFSTQLLLIQEIIGTNGIPTKLTSVITHLHYHEPSNFAFAYLLRSGALKKLINGTNNHTDIHWSLIIVICHLFTNLRLNKTVLHKNYNNSIVILEPLPKVILNALKEYNDEVKFIFSQYFLSIAKHLANKLGVDDTLPLSKVKIQPIYDHKEDDTIGSLSDIIKKTCLPTKVCSAFVALSGLGDNDLFTKNMITNIRHEICPDIQVIPTINLSRKLNSYAADFYRHGIISAIINDNGLRSGEEFTRLKDFLLVLKTIVIGLEELGPSLKVNPIVEHFNTITLNFSQLFEKAFSKTFF